MMRFKKNCIFIIGFCAVLQPLGMDIFVSNLPMMMDFLHFSESEIQYILVAFVFASGIPQLFIGYYADKYGRRPLMLATTLGFSIASYLCISTMNLVLLTAFRFIQGLCASGCISLSYSVIRDTYSGKESSKKYSQLSCILAMTPMLAPLLGTILVDILHNWQSTFGFLVLFSLFTFLITFKFLPETKKVQENISSKNTGYVRNLSKILDNKVFWTFCMCSTTTMTGLFLYFQIGSIVLLERLHIDSYTYSYLFAINAISYLSANYLASKLVHRLRIITLVSSGNILVVGGALIMMMLNLTLGLSAISFVIGNVLITIGGGLMTGPATSAALEPFPNEAGFASGVFGAIQYGLPALIGFFVTRFEITSAANLALPMLCLSLLNIGLLLHYACSAPKECAAT